VNNLGSVSGLPTPYVGLTFKPGDANTVLVGSGSAQSEIFSIGVSRDSNNHITGFTGTATFFANAPGMAGGAIDAGLTVGPGNVLFYSTWPDNTIGQIKPGSTTPNKQIDLTSLGFSASAGGITFVPAGLPGAGRLKITSYDTNTFYDTTIAPDGTGTFNIAPPSKSVVLSGGTDAFSYVAAGNPGFTKASLLMAEIDSGKVAAYEVDGNGDPIATSRQDFLTDINGVIGMAVDPLTGDLFLSTYSYGAFNPDGKNEIVVVRGFTPAEATPEPLTLLGAATALGFGAAFKRQLAKQPKKDKSKA
jgi:hypothetical protein